jgi:hypothetical protein
MEVEDDDVARQVGSTVRERERKKAVPVWDSMLGHGLLAVLGQFLPPWPFSIFFSSFLLFLFVFSISFISFSELVQIDSNQFVNFSKIQINILRQ